MRRVGMRRVGMRSCACGWGMIMRMPPKRNAGWRCAARLQLHALPVLLEEEAELLRAPQRKHGDQHLRASSIRRIDPDRTGTDPARRLSAAEARARCRRRRFRACRSASSGTALGRAFTFMYAVHALQPHARALCAWHTHVRLARAQARARTCIQTHARTHVCSRSHARPRTHARTHLAAPVDRAVNLHQKVALAAALRVADGRGVAAVAAAAARIGGRPRDRRRASSLEPLRLPSLGTAASRDLGITE
jgi:hypothetical protein